MCDSPVSSIIFLISKIVCLLVSIFVVIIGIICLPIILTGVIIMMISIDKIISPFKPVDAVVDNSRQSIVGSIHQIIAKSAEALSQICLDKLSFESALKISDAAISEDDGAENTASNTPALKAALSNRTQQSRLLQHDIRLLSPIIALGASAKTHYPHIAERLNTSLVIFSITNINNNIKYVNNYL